MQKVSRIYVDTNVFILLFERRDKVSNLLAELFLIDRTGRESLLATSELTLAELLVDPHLREPGAHGDDDAFGRVDGRRGYGHLFRSRPARKSRRARRAGPPVENLSLAASSSRFSGR